MIPLPADVSRVLAVHVNGVPLRSGDYRSTDRQIVLERPVRPARPIGLRGLLQVALCIEVVPDGDSIDVTVVRRDGAVTTLGS